MLDLAWYFFFKQSVSFIFVIDILVLMTCFYRYIGLGYDSTTILDSMVKQSLVLIVWILGATGLVLNVFPLVSSMLLWLCFRYVHIDRRGKSLARGAGAVGLMPYHTASYLVLVEGALYLNASDVIPLINAFYMLDIMMIMFDAGLYKALSGYFNGHGIEYALINPLWGRYWRVKAVLNSWVMIKLLFILNLFGATTELLASFLIFYPIHGINIGGILIACIFIFAELTIKLITLPLLMIVIGIYIAYINIEIKATVLLIQQYELLSAFLIVYLVLTLLCKINFYYNYFTKQKLPPIIHKPLLFIAKYLPVTIWRVFTADITSNFFEVDVRFQNGQYAQIFGRKVSYWNSNNTIRNKIRYLFVTESVVLSTLASYWRYAPKDTSLMQQKLTQYSNTLDYKFIEGDIIKYTYNVIKKDNRGRLYYLSTAQWELIALGEGKYSIKYTQLVEDAWGVSMLQNTKLKPSNQYGEYC